MFGRRVYSPLARKRKNNERVFLLQVLCPLFVCFFSHSLKFVWRSSTASQRTKIIFPGNVDTRAIPSRNCALLSWRRANFKVQVLEITVCIQGVTFIRGTDIENKFKIKLMPKIGGKYSLRIVRSTELVKPLFIFSFWMSLCTVHLLTFWVKKKVSCLKMRARDTYLGHVGMEFFHYQWLNPPLRNEFYLWRYTTRVTMRVRV